MPLALGLAHLLSRIPLPGSVPRPVWVAALVHPERDKRVAVGIVVLVALGTATSLAWTGRLAPPGTFTALPQYWHRGRGLARRAQPGSTGNDPAAGRVLVVPGAPFATQTWGNSHDEPLQVLGHSPWGVRDSIPLTPPQTIRALDSVQRLFAAGRPSAGLADTLARQGISYVVAAQRSRPRRVKVRTPAAGSPRHRRIARPERRWRSSASPSAQARLTGSSPTAGCVRAIRPWRSIGSTVLARKPIRASPT